MGELLKIIPSNIGAMRPATRFFVLPAVVLLGYIAVRPLMMASFGSVLLGTLAGIILFRLTETRFRRYRGVIVLLAMAQIGALEAAGDVNRLALLLAFLAMTVLSGAFDQHCPARLVHPAAS